MESKELRIGNLVYVQSEIVQIEEICKNKTLPNKIGIQHYNTWSSLELCKPITINPEWILKLGFDTFETFERGTNLIHGIYAKTISLKTIPDFKIEFGGNLNYEVGIKYVHQLQNLVFVMTGQDLIVNDLKITN